MERMESSVSSFIAEKLPNLVRKGLKNTLIPVTSVLTKWVKKVDSDLENSGIDSINSGSTWWVAVIKNKTIYFANTGDSRAILIKFNKDIFSNDLVSQIQNERKDSQLRNSETKMQINPIVSIWSTNDHSWEVEAEQQRIISSGGRVERINKKIGPLRVWLKDEDKPGLAMTRSIGDHIAKNIGVICTPEVHFEKLDLHQMSSNSCFYEYILK